MDAEQRLHLSMRSDWQQRLKIRPDRTAVVETLGQPRYRRRLKQAADRQLNIKARADPADQTRRKQRVTAQRKKVILNPNPRDPQYLRKQRAQNLLLRRARQTTANPPPILRRRQRCAVQLPVRRQRKTIQLDNRRRNHVIRQPQTNMRTQRRRIDRPPRRRNHVADKLRPARAIPARNNRSLRYAPLPKQRSLDLPRLNPEPANLNLLVRAPHKLQHPIKPPARQVPAAVHPTPTATKPIRNKALRTQPPTTQIPSPNPRTRDVKLPNNPNRKRLQTTIQNINPVVGQRTANRDVRAPLLTFNSNSNGIDRRFGRAIEIRNVLHIEISANVFLKCCCEDFSSQNQVLQKGVLRSTANDRVHVGRHATHKSHVVADQLVPELGRRFPYRITDDDRRSTPDKWQHRLLNRGVKSTRNGKRGSETDPHLKILRERQNLIGKTCMLDRHAFGYSGGAGGIDDVGEVVRLKPRGRRACGLRRNRLRLGIKLDDPRAVAGQPSAQRRGGDQQWRAGVVQHERQTRGWVAGVERQIGAARLENAEQPHQQRRRALNAKPNHRLRTNPLRAQMLRQLIGPRLKLPVAQPLVRKYNRNRIRPRRRLRRKQLRQRRWQNRTSRRVPILQQPPTLRRRQKLKPTNRHIRIANCSQQVQESLLVVCKIRRGIKCRIGIKVDPKRSTIRAIINSDRQVLDRSKREIMCDSIISGKTKTVIKPHDVDVKPEQPLAIADPSIPSQVCNLITLVPKYSTHLPGDLT